MALVPEQEYVAAHREEELHRLIADNPKLILRESSQGELLPALTIGSHFGLGDVEADLVVVDLTGAVFLVEVKRDRTPRDVVAQIMDYAARLRQLGLEGMEDVLKQQYPGGTTSVLGKLLDENPDFKDTEYDDPDSFRRRFQTSIAGNELQLVIVSYSVGEDIQRTVEHLREVYKVNIYCVEFDYYVSEEYEYFAPEIVGAESRRPPPPEATPKQIEYRDFWESLLQELRQRVPNITRERALPQSWLGVPIGHSGIHLEWAFHGRPRNSFEVGLHLERAEHEENYRILQLLKKDSLALEKEIGEKLEFQERWGKRWSRLFALRNEGEMTEDLRKWAIDTMVKFYSALRPRLGDALKELRPNEDKLQGKQ